MKLNELKVVLASGSPRRLEILEGDGIEPLVLRPGCEIGWHIHHGDGETYYILRGRGLYNDNGAEIEVGPGDVTFVDSEEGHALRNIGKEDLEAIALILFK